MEAKVLAFANHKGGVGKTTSVANLGAAIAALGRRVLLVDLDAQCNLTYTYLQEEPEATLYEALTGTTGVLPRTPIAEGLDIVPAGLGLAKADIDLSTRIAREAILRSLLKPLRSEYDYILLDCPPSLGVVTTNALAAADGVIIPLTAEALPLKGLTMLDAVIDEIRRTLNPALKLVGVIVNRYNYRKLNSVVEGALREKYGDLVFSTMIRENITIAEAPLTGTDVVNYDRSSNGAKDFTALAEELVGRFEDNK